MLKTGLVSRYGSDQFVCLTCDDCDLSPEAIDRIEEEISENAPIPNLMSNMEFIRILINLYLFL